MDNTAEQDVTRLYELVMQLSEQLSNSKALASSLAGRAGNLKVL